VAIDWYAASASVANQPTGTPGLMMPPPTATPKYRYGVRTLAEHSVVPNGLQVAGTDCAASVTGDKHNRTASERKMSDLARRVSDFIVNPSMNVRNPEMSAPISSLSCHGC
jgi:hypothetical protein